MVFPACQMPMRSGDSCFVYQDEVIKETAGTNGPSVTPTMNRQRMNPQPRVMAGMQIVVADQASMQQGIRRRGLPLAMMMLAGI